MKKVMMVLILVAANQGFAATPTLNNSFAEALKESEGDHFRQQVVLNVSPSQIEKATFKRDNTVHVVKVEDNMLTDIKHSAPKMKEVVKPTKENDDFARLQQELNGL